MRARSLWVYHTVPFFADNFLSPIQSPQLIKPLSTVIRSPFPHPLTLGWPCKFFGQSNEPERTSSCCRTEILRSLAAFFVSLSQHFYLWTDRVELMGDGDHVEQKWADQLRSNHQMNEWGHSRLSVPSRAANYKDQRIPLRPDILGCPSHLSQLTEHKLDNKYLWFLATRLWGTWIIFSFLCINSTTILENLSVHVEILQTSFIPWFGFFIFEELYLHLKKSTAWYLSIYLSIHTTVCSIDN